MNEGNDKAPAGANDALELSISRFIEATPAQIFAAWADAETLKRWWAPKPWTTPFASIDLRTGGTFATTMRGPAGEEFAGSGVFLEVVPEKRIVFTDAYTSAWVPSEKPFFTAIVELTPEGSGTRYVARARHWTREAYEQHKAMGFEQGWMQVAGQLGEVVGAR